GFYQPAKKRKHDRVVMYQIFRVPLDAESKRVADGLDALDQSVRGMGRGHKPGGQIANPLVVEAVDVGLADTQRLRQFAARLDSDGMGLVIAREDAEEIVLDRAGHPLHDILI